LRNAALNINLLALILIIGALFSCGQKKICPAYQSVFYLNSEIADEDFSYFGADSMPKIENVVKKTDVLLIVKIGKKKREKLMATIPMITIFPDVADSLLAQNDQDEMYDEVDPDAEIEQGEPEYDESGNLMPPRRKSELPPGDPEISDPTIIEIPDDDVEDLTSSEEAKRLKKNESKKEDKKAKKKDKKPIPKKVDDIKPKDEEPEEEEQEKDEF
jgi:hypothetical protein